MPSVWIQERMAKSGRKSHRILYRIGGRESKPQSGGTFSRKRDAITRAAWITGELAARRIPDLSFVAVDPPQAPTLGEATEAWRISRVDVEDDTKNMHTSAIGRIWKVAPQLRSCRIDELTVDDVTGLIAALATPGAGRNLKPYKRETMKKTRDALAQTLDHFGIEPNVVRDKRVKLPKEAKAHVPPPLADHVERVAERMPKHHVLPLLILDECGPRVNELATAQVGDLDEHRKAIRVRWTVEKNERYRHLELPDDLFDAVLAAVPPREDRDLEAPLFPDLNAAAIRTAISKACKATGTPHFAPHGLRRRRGSLHYRRTGSLADVAELLGDSKRVAAAHYIYALTDYREVDRTIALARIAR
jgi:integrase